MDSRERRISHKVLTQADLEEVNELASICNKYEELDYLTPNIGMMAILCYVGTQLIGLLAIQLGIDEAELYTIVRPDNRRKGIASSLLEAAKVRLKKDGILKCLLVRQASSESGEAFVNSTGAQYRFSEFRMELENAAFRNRKSSDSMIELRQANPPDANILAGLSAKSFGDSEERHLKRYEQDLQKSTHRFHIISLDGQPIGSIGTVSSPSRIWIVAFGITPGFRGRGHGARALGKVVEALLEEGCQQITIEVETNNRNALDLYKQCGFKEQSEYRYYSLSL
jgi:ribosomal protein S18 acetylase RimI-like enzyme